MEVTMPQYLLASLLKDAAEMGATNALTQAGLLKPFMSIAEAKRKYGARTLQRWIKEGKIKLRKESPASIKFKILRSEIDALEKASSKPIYNQITSH